MDPDGRPNGDGSTLDDNVVRLPRDWLGPREELVPLAPSTDEQSASDFWGEGSSALQTALEAPPSSVPAPSRLPGGLWRAGVVAAAAALLVGAVMLATSSPKPPVSTHRTIPYVATSAPIHRALDWSASRRGQAKRRTTARTRHRAERTVVVEQVRYVTVPAQSSVAVSHAPTASSSPQTSSASSNPAAGSVNQPAVGADGALGPGTSPDG